MTRHGRNATASSVYSYAERRKDQRESGWGNLHERLTKDAIKEFDCCSLTLQPCKEPLVSPHGVLFDKEAVLEYIIRQKKEGIRKLKEWEKQRRSEKEELAELARAERESKAQKFTRQESTPAHPGTSQSSDGKTPITEIDEKSVSNMTNGKAKDLPSFWIPSLQPAAEKSKMEKPTQKVFCPVTKKPLKMKDLIPVIFTPIKDGHERAKPLSKQVRYMCAVTHDALTNVSTCAVLRTSGNVVTKRCIEEIIRKDWVDPTNDKPLTEEDIIWLERGGTGYAEVNKDALDGTLNRPAALIA